MANANSDRARRMLVRTALVTSTTVATIIGAQNLAMLDKQTLTTLTPMVDLDDLLPTGTIVPTVRPVATEAQEVASAPPQLNIVHAAPSIIVLRQPGQTVVERSANQQPIIQPPNPVQLAAPPPIIIQQTAVPLPQPSNSSGGGNHSSGSSHSSSRSSR